VGSVACKQVSKDCADLLAPKQLGFGVQGGAEIGVHATRRFVENMIPGQVFIKIDFKNAFNNIRKDSMLEAVQNHFPQLLPFVLSSYSQTSELWFGPHTISSEEGAQQGDPLEMGSEIGLTLNQAKCEVIGHNNATRAIFRDCEINLPETELQDMTMLSSPVLPGPGIYDVLSRKRIKLERLSTRLAYMPSHDSLYLLRHVVTTPRIMYTLRTSPCTDSNELLKYDETIQSTLSSKVNIELTESGWRQAVLPVRWCGL